MGLTLSDTKGLILLDRKWTEGKYRIRRRRGKGDGRNKRSAGDKSK